MHLASESRRLHKVENVNQSTLRVPKPPLHPDLINSASITTIPTNSLKNTLTHAHYFKALIMPNSPSNFPLLTSRELLDLRDELRDIWLWLGLLSVLFFSRTSWQLYDVCVTTSIGWTLPAMQRSVTNTHWRPAAFLRASPLLIYIEPISHSSIYCHARGDGGDGIHIGE